MFFVFVTWDPMGAKPSILLLLPQIAFGSFQTFPEFSSECPLKKVLFWILKFWVYDFFFFSFSLTCDSMGSKSSKRYSSIKSLNFLLSGAHKSTVLDF